MDVVLPPGLLVAPAALGAVALSDTAAEGRDADAARDARLVAAALEKPDAYRHLVLLNQARVYATALRILGDESEARDVAQEAFLKAFRALSRFDGRRRFGPWICAITANVARDHLRMPFRRWFRTTEGSPVEVASEAPADPDDDRTGSVAAAILRLAPKLREALVLRYVAGLTVEEVAAALGIGESATKMRLKRGVEQLRAALGQE